MAYRWFARFRDDATWERINHHLVMLDRERAGREAALRWFSIGFADATLHQLRPTAAVRRLRREASDLREWPAKRGTS